MHSSQKIYIGNNVFGYETELIYKEHSAAT